MTINPVEAKKFGEITSATVEEIQSVYEEEENTEQIELFTSDEGAEKTGETEESSSASPLEKSVSSSAKKGADSSAVSAFDNPAEGENCGDSVIIRSKKADTSLNEPEKDEKEKALEEKKKEGFKKQALACIKNKEDFADKDLDKDLEKLYLQLKDASFTDKSRLVAQFLKEKNIDVDDNEFKALIEGYIKYETEYDSSNLSILYKKNLSQAEAEKAAKLLVGIYNGDVKIDKNDPGGQILKAFCANVQTAKSIDKEQYTKLLTDYIYKRSRIETLEELEKLDAEFLDQTDTEIMSQIKNQYEKYTASRLLTPDDVSKQREYSLQAKTHLFECMVALARNEEEKKSTYRTQEKSIKSTQKRFTELTEKYITEKHTKEQAEEILKEAGKYTEEQAKKIAASMEINGLDDDFKAEMHSKLLKSIKQAKEYTTKFIQQFFKTEKGKAILSYTRQKLVEVREKKADLKEAQEESEKAQEAAKEAQKVAEEAIAKAKKEEAKAATLAEQFGLKDLSFDKLFKFAKKVSTKLAFDLVYSQEDKKKAQNAEIEATFAKEHAYSQEKIARMNLAIARAQMQAAMISAEANLRVAMSQA